MREVVQSIADGNVLYYARRGDYDTNAEVPFVVPPEPLTLPNHQLSEIDSIGIAVTSYLSSVGELYGEDETVRRLLDAGKPEIILGDLDSSNYLFVRPDLIVTPGGFKICEIETSPFGLALADILNKAYASAGFETIVGTSQPSETIREGLPDVGTIVYSPKTAAYRGQLTYLSDHVFPDGGDWDVARIDEIDQSNLSSVYRAFYLSEYDTDDSVRQLLDDTEISSSIIPGLTPQLEEKAVMALIWDKRWEAYFAKSLGEATLGFLRATIPPTWIVGEEEYFAPGLPYGVAQISDLAGLSRSKRTFVLKPSHGSWSEGVEFLHEKSQAKALELIERAAKDSAKVHIVQEFHKPQKNAFKIDTPAGSSTVQAKVRITPYFSALAADFGELIGIKATACENTDYIHASSTSINTAIAKGRNKS